MSSHKRPGAGEEGAGPSKRQAASAAQAAATLTAAPTRSSWQPELLRTSPTFTGIYKNGVDSWTARKTVDGVQRYFEVAELEFHIQPCEGKAAVLHDIATLWSLLRKNGALLSVKYISPSTASNAPSRAMLPSHMHAAPLHSQVV